MSSQGRHFQTSLLVTMICSYFFVGPLAAQPGPKNIGLRFQQTEIATVLTALADQMEIDVLIGPGVEGKIDLNLTDVDWKTALESIITSRGLTYGWQDNVLVVLLPGEHSKALLSHRIVHLNYADPAAIKASLVNALSAQGKIEILTAPQQGNGEIKDFGAPILVVSELPHRMAGILELIDSLDTPRRQIEIAVKFIEHDIDDESNVGLSWPTKIGATVASIPASGSETSNSTEQISSASYNLPDGNTWKLGTLSIDELSGFLEMLERNGRSKLLQDPRVTVLENQQAQMKVTTTFPVQTINRFSEGSTVQDIVDFEDLEVGLTLTVTPRVNANGQISLEVEPVIEEITGFTGPADNQRPITARRTVKTHVRVQDNETIVIGGLVRETNITTVSKVWLLGDIPVLGRLFRHQANKKKKSDLLIFITPRLLDDTPVP